MVTDAKTNRAPPHRQPDPGEARTQAMLAVTELNKAFGGLQAVQALSFDVAPGEILGFIGPNGAGKTTVFRLISGAHLPDAGRICLDGVDITGWPTHRVVNAGITRTFQTPRPFHHKSVAENVEIALLPNALFGQRIRREHAKISELCARVGLCHVLDHEPSTDGRGCACWETSPDVLPQAGLRQLEIARALASDPKVILLDEPFAGLTSDEVERLSGTLAELRDEGRTMVLVDHNMQGLMRLVDRVLVIHFGRKIAEGDPVTIADDPQVQEAYLAGSDSELSP
ncbi:MAG: ABC transporter ATP-binding protein [Candidatus Bipolaricaulia bacterium]